MTGWGGAVWGWVGSLLEEGRDGEGQGYRGAGQNSVGSGWSETGWSVAGTGRDVAGQGGSFEGCTTPLMHIETIEKK